MGHFLPARFPYSGTGIDEFDTTLEPADPSAAEVQLQNVNCVTLSASVFVFSIFLPNTPAV